MDNLTHALTGAGVAAMAYGTAAVSGEPKLAQAVFWGTALASQAPDLDIVLRLKGNSTYLKHHRGFSHSIPAQLLIPSLTTLVVMLFFPGVSWLTVWLWSYLATLAHVFMDVLTAYGTKALWPLSNKMYALDILLIVDLVIIVLFGTGAVLWYMGRSGPADIFRVIWSLTALYLALRGVVYYRMKNIVRRKFGPQALALSVIPTLHLLNWNFVAETGDRFLAGVVSWPNRVEVEKSFPKVPEDQVIAAAWEAPGARVFVEFARHMWVAKEETPDGYKVHFSDLRFLFGDKTPFTATVFLDRDLRVVDEQFGWVRGIRHPVQTS
ncbi:MAG: metal-dependent hydrolase [Bacillota bacterium]